MNTKVSSRDWEALSAYLDDALPPREQERLEARLRSEPALQEALASLERTRSVLRAAPRVRAPRNFTLTPEMVAARPSLLDWLRPTLQWSSAVAALLLMLVLAGQYLLMPAGRMQSAAPPAPEFSPASQTVRGEEEMPAAAETAPLGKAAPEALPAPEGDTAMIAPAGGQNLSVSTGEPPTATPLPTATPAFTATPRPLPAPSPEPSFPWALLEGALAFIAVAGGAAAWYLRRRG